MKNIWNWFVNNFRFKYNIGGSSDLYTIGSSYPPRQVPVDHKRSTEAEWKAWWNSQVPSFSFGDRAVMVPLPTKKDTISESELKQSIGLHEPYLNKLDEFAKTIEGIWAERQSLAERYDKLSAREAKLLKALQGIESGMLPNGDHVEGSVAAYAGEVLHFLDEDES
jgi:hypothetical protein